MNRLLPGSPLRVREQTALYAGRLVVVPSVTIRDNLGRLVFSNNVFCTGLVPCVALSHLLLTLSFSPVVWRPVARALAREYPIGVPEFHIS